MSQPKKSVLHQIGGGPLTIEQLEEGLRLLGRGDVDQNAFWDENVEAFRRTVLFAIRDTSNALLSRTISLRWCVELQKQLEELVRYIELADRYIARRRPSCGPAGLESPPTRASIH